MIDRLVDAQTIYNNHNNNTSTDCCLIFFIEINTKHFQVPASQLSVVVFFLTP